MSLLLPLPQQHLSLSRQAGRCRKANTHILPTVKAKAIGMFKAFYETSYRKQIIISKAIGTPRREYAASSSGFVPFNVLV